MTEVNPIVIKKTQDTLGKFIKKPNLTDKLLRKPPFKFLHDILTNVIKTTGLFDGLYTEDELQSENITERDAKIAFLQKAIDVIKYATNEQIKARPSKIVAGLEADKTNEFLQSIGKAIERKIDTKSAVEAVREGKIPSPPEKKGKSKPTKAGSNAANKESKKPNPGITKPKRDASTEKAQKQSSGDKIIKKSVERKASRQESNDSTTKTSGNKKEKDKENGKPRKENVEKKSSGKQRSDNDNKPIVEPIVEKPKETNEINTSQETTEIKLNDTNNNANNNNNSNPNILSNEIDTTIVDTQKELKISSANNESDGKNELKRNQSIEEKPKTPSPPASLPEEVSSLPPEPEKPKIKPESIDLPKKSSFEMEEKQKEIKEKDIKEKEKEKIDISQEPLMNGSVKPPDASEQPRIALRSAARRPVSARPSAPRRRDRNVQQIVHHEGLNQNLDNAGNYEKKKDMIAELDDSDNIIIADIMQENDLSSETNAPENAEISTDGKQGHLVQQILETQQTLTRVDSNDNNKKMTNDTIADGKTQIRNINELRQNIQKLSHFIAPLGKLMEYFQEDIDAMQIELGMWQSAYTTATNEIKNEEQQTDNMLEQYKYDLIKIEDNIKDSIEQINSVKANILQNDEKISKLVANL